MTDNMLYLRLTALRESVDADRYPQIVEVIDDNLLDGEVDLTPYQMAYALMEADPAERLPDAAAALVKEIFLEEAENGNVNAWTNLGALYYTGRIGEQSYEKAVHYYTLAADHGELQAMENLGYCWYYGRTGEVDYKKAYHYFIKGALAGSINSRYKIGDMYRNGYYVEKDEQLAFRIYNDCSRALSNYDTERFGAAIWLRLGEAYEKGIGTGRNPEWALIYYQKAEQMFYQKIQNGDYFAKSELDKAIGRQDALRAELRAALPAFNWRESVETAERE